MKNLLWLLLGVVLAACAPQPDTLPTLLPSITPTESPPTATFTAEPTLPSATPLPSATFTPQPTFTYTPTVTASVTPSTTPTRAPATVNATTSSHATATAMVLERPVFATFTPVPAGVDAPPVVNTTPQMIADLVISEGQFQEEVTRLLQDKPRVQDVEIGFTPAGVRVSLSADDGQAITTGVFTVYFQLTPGDSGNIVIIQADAPADFAMAGNQPPTDTFIDIAYVDVLPSVFEAFNSILNTRLGVGTHDLENLVIDDLQMAITLYVARSS